MPKVKISDEEFEQLEDNRRHDELLVALDKIAKRDPTNGLGAALAKQAEQITQVLQKDTTKQVMGELKPLIEALTASVKELKTVLSQKTPSTFRVQREPTTGLIEKVVVEKLSGN